MSGLVHIPTLSSNNIGVTIDSYPSWTPRISTFRIINHNCYLFIFQNILVFFRFDDIYSTDIEISTVIIKANRDYVWLNKLATVI